MNTFYWHDYETWGIQPAIDRPSQFAGVRTDENLDIIGEPLVLYCQPAEDILPHPGACLVTGISPLTARDKGLPEREFIAAIHAEMMQTKTCTVGYNSLRFDDEVTRYTLYRNYFDPYEREWRNGNSRWDIIDMLRMCYALRPEGIEWPMLDGKPTFRLENLTAANNISHADAHDAYADVVATIEMAKRVREHQPALYQYLYEKRDKKKVAELIDLKNKKPLFHISSKFPAENGCAGFISPVVAHPTNKNAIVVFNLAVDPSPMEHLSVEEISERIFTAQSDLPEGVERLPVKLIHLNKCPALAIPKILDSQGAKRLKIDKSACEKNWQKLCELNIEEKLRQVFLDRKFANDGDPETQLYQGFVNDRDKAQMSALREADGDTLKDQNFIFNDARLNGMLLGYKARNVPEALSETEKQEWHEWVRERLQAGGAGRLSLAEIKMQIERNQAEQHARGNSAPVLDALVSYLKSLELKFAL